MAEFCERFDVDLNELRAASGIAFIALWDAAMDERQRATPR